MVNNQPNCTSRIFINEQDGGRKVMIIQNDAGKWIVSETCNDPTNMGKFHVVEIEDPEAYIRGLKSCGFSEL